MNCPECDVPVVVVATDMVNSNDRDPAIKVDYYYCANTECCNRLNPMRCHEVKFN